MDKAIFLDRDGTIIQLIKNLDTGQMEPPRTPEQVKFCDYAIEFMIQLQNKDYRLFIISNQPDVAKGKQTSDQLFHVHERINNMMYMHGVNITKYYYCFHHPDGTHPLYSTKCECRKPLPGFILEATKQYNLNLNKSWIIGDQETDIECGKNAGVNGIKINSTMPLKQAYKIISKGI